MEAWFLLCKVTLSSLCDLQIFVMIWWYPINSCSNLSSSDFIIHEQSFPESNILLDITKNVRRIFNDNLCRLWAHSIPHLLLICSTLKALAHNFGLSWLQSIKSEESYSGWKTAYLRSDLYKTRRVWNTSNRNIGVQKSQPPHHFLEITWDTLYEILIEWGADNGLIMLGSINQKN